MNIDPKKELFIWGPIDVRLSYPSFFVELIIKKLKKYYKWLWPDNLSIFINGRMTWINDYLSLCQTGLKYFKHYFLNENNFKKIWRKWEEWIEEYKIVEKKFEKLNFKKLDDKSLIKKLRFFYDFNMRFWLIVHVPEIANWGGEYLLKNELRKRYLKKAEEYLEILSAPVKFSFFQQEELELLKIALLCHPEQSEGSPTNVGSHSREILHCVQNDESIREALVKHTHKYHWILNSYGGNRVLKPSYFENKLKELLEEKSARVKIKEIKNIIEKSKRRKKELVRKLKLNKEIIWTAHQLSESIWWQDLRKGYIWRMNYFWDKFMKEVARRRRWKFSDLQWCYGRELLNILKNKRVKRREILARKRYYSFYAAGGKFREFYDEEFIKDLWRIYYTGAEIKNVGEFRGLVVSKGKGGKIRGRVKIVKNPYCEEKKMSRGDILVAGMTSPEYIVVMRKAAAIITDAGGMTSHAAIVSRELDIPCIVGTKIATRVLKDGDLVEVDATKGLVRLIRRTARSDSKNPKRKIVRIIKKI